jgi:hypothetical protein
MYKAIRPYTALAVFPTWKSKAEIWPHLYQMAMDYLAVQGAATAVERVWSSASDTDTKKRNRLLPERLEALQFLKATYRKLRVRTLTPEEKEALIIARRDLINEMNWEDDYVKRASLNEDELYACLDLI